MSNYVMALTFAETEIRALRVYHFPANKMKESSRLWQGDDETRNCASIRVLKRGMKDAEDELGR